MNGKERKKAAVQNGTPILPLNSNIWQPVDDLKLILNVQQAKDLSLVFNCVKFSQRFTLEDIQERWFQLFHNPAISKGVQKAIEGLSKNTVDDIKAGVLWSPEEENLLKRIPSTAVNNMETFTAIMEKNRDVFWHLRTAESLRNHWKDMRRYFLLDDQRVDPDILRFLKEQNDPMFNTLYSATSSIEDSAVNLTLLNSEISEKEQELIFWQRAITKPEEIIRNERVFAIFRSQVSAYLICDIDVKIGANIHLSQVHIDISDEFPSSYSTRVLIIIKYFHENSQFILANRGECMVYVNENLVNPNEESFLTNGSVVRIAKVVFDFIDQRNNKLEMNKSNLQTSHEHTIPSPNHNGKKSR